MKDTKKKRGDRKDATWIRDADPLHSFMPYLLLGRTDNEALLNDEIDITRVTQYLEKKNADNPVFKYTMFHVIVAAMIKTITLRPKMNRFIANKNMYQRNEVSAAFTIKKIFSDEGGEALAFLHAKDDSTLETIHEDLFRQISHCKSEKNDASTDVMDLLVKFPRFLVKFVVWILTRLDVHGWIPQSIIATDPYYSSVVLSNVGSIKLKCGYHHLTNWGTCSVFCLIGEKNTRPVYDEHGNVQMKEMLDIGLTIDERIADGYYYAKTIKLLKYLLQNPELLERPASEPVDYIHA